MPENTGRFNTTAEIGEAGLSVNRGQITEDFLRELRGSDGYRRYNEMRLNCPVVGAELTAIEQTMRTAVFDTTSDQGENDPRIEFVNESFDNLTRNMNDHISEVLTMLWAGYSIFEIVYERVNGRLLWKKFAARGQDTVRRWEFDDNGGLKGFWQVASPSWTEVFIPIEKCILYRTKVEKNNPEGRSILRTGWIPYYYLKNIQQIEAIGVERDLAGMPVVTMPPGATTGENDSNSDEYKAMKMVRNIRNDEQAGITIPDGWKVELMSTGGSRQFDTDKIITRYESRILMSCLSQFLLLGQDRVGTQALSQDQTNFFAQAVNSFADIICETFTKYGIARLLELNGFDPDGVSLTHTPAGEVDLGALADFLQKTSDKITWLPQDEAWLRGVADLPEVDEETIQAERDAKQQRAMQIAQRAQPSPFEKKDEEGEDELGAELFAARDRPKDEKERLAMERRFELQQRRFFAEQYDRILKSVKGLNG